MEAFNSHSSKMVIDPRSGGKSGDDAILRGNFRLLLAYDVAEVFDLATIKQLLGNRCSEQVGEFGRRSPSYIRFQDPPLTESAEPLTLSTGEQAKTSVRYYAFGVAVLQLELAFECKWAELISRSATWTEIPNLRSDARKIVEGHIAALTPAIVRPTKDWLSEEYAMVVLQEILGAPPSTAATEYFRAVRTQEIAQIVRNEDRPLATEELNETLAGALSYYESDFIAVGPAVAFIYDQPQDATIEGYVLEYAKLQLLEFRYYDRLTALVLDQIYDSLDKRTRLLARWTLPRDAKHFNRVRLDIVELTERVDNAIKFVSDVYYARLYRLAAQRMGVPEYRQLIGEKLNTIGELYDFMIDQFNEARSFVIEAIIAVLALMDIILLFRGR